MPTTPTYALPYPAETDTADVPRDMQALANRLEVVLPTASVGVPTGAGIDWYTTVAPSGFLLCDGSAVSRTTFAALFAVLGTIWGPGDGSTTFNLPDTRGRVIVGRNPGGPAHVNLGENDGQAAAARRIQHTHQQALTLPAHGHGITDPSHFHFVWNGADDGGFNYGASWLNRGAPQGGSGGPNQTTGISVGNPTSYPAINGTVGWGVGGDAPCFVVVSKAIKS